MPSCHYFAHCPGISIVDFEQVNVSYQILLLA